MKISPMTGGGLPGVNLSGQPTNLSTPDPQVQRAQDVRRLKMRTNVSPDRPVETPPEAVAAESATPDKDETTAEVTEATKPLSPQFAELAKLRRSLQVKERELTDREKALETKLSAPGSDDLIARLKSQPLSVLQEHGVTYDQLTEAILADQNNINPELVELRNKIKALEEGVEKKFVDRESQAEEAALTEMLTEAEALIKEGDDFELVRENGKVEDVLRHIYSTYKTTGRVMDVREALSFIEEREFNSAMKLANLNKVKSKLAPAQPQPVQRQSTTMKTLTNRDSASVGMPRRERALLAAQGLLTKG